MKSKSETPELPTELICFQILSRLPTKLVVRCRCVCKSWSDLTRHPSFLAFHRSFRCSSFTHLLFTTSSETTTAPQHFYSCKLNQEGGNNNIINPTKHLFSLPAPAFSFLAGTHSLNGLTILADEYINEKPVYVFNPCTEEIITLTDTNFVADLSTHHLGFSAVTNEYKVLQVHWSGSSDGEDQEKYVTSLMFKIFTLGTTSWRHIELNFPFDPRRLGFAKKSVCLHGGIHWMHMNQKIIVVFDVAAERFRANVPLPGDFDSGDIVEAGGCVAVYGDKSLIQQDIMLMWILEDYENHVWVKKTIIFPSGWETLRCPIPVGTIHTGELLLKPTIRDSDDICVHLYNMESDSFRKCKIGLPVKYGLWSLLTSYDESVIFLRS
ncbi:PREDICTED: F-box protein At5g62510-like [Fragaria vesca subsp. vesca]|uniref:F-box protein At5g62510-like n=1 Tax=Fragaria vesca subsp. vesca TaxID=101020 RepID=UPI0002C31591|nr:PREDICTED: F-box protein At5g62510-like [Fragaria vesca subsp. vesca]